MATATKIGAYLDALVASLAARSGLVGVSVTSGWIGPDGGLRSIQFTDAHLDYDWSSSGRRRYRETAIITGFIWVEYPGAGEAAIKASRDSAEALLDEVMAELNANPSQGITETETNALFTSRDDEWAVSASKARATRITFTLTVNFQITP